VSGCGVSSSPAALSFFFSPKPFRCFFLAQTYGPFIILADGLFLFVVMQPCELLWRISFFEVFFRMAFSWRQRTGLVFDYDLSFG